MVVHGKVEVATLMVIFGWFHQYPALPHYGVFHQLAACPFQESSYVGDDQETHWDQALWIEYC